MSGKTELFKLYKAKPLLRDFLQRTENRFQDKTDSLSLFKKYEKCLISQTLYTKPVGKQSLYWRA